MMTPPKLVEYISAEPFRPFRIKMASGQTYEIRHPEIILVGRSSARGYTTPGGVPGKPAQWHDVCLMLMETLEPMESKPSAGLN